MKARRLRPLGKKIPREAEFLVRIVAEDVFMNSARPGFNLRNSSEHDGRASSALPLTT